MNKTGKESALCHREGEAISHKCINSGSGNSAHARESGRDVGAGLTAVGWGWLGWDDEVASQRRWHAPTPELEEPIGRPLEETAFQAESTAGAKTGPSLGFQEGTKGPCAGAHRGRGVWLRCEGREGTEGLDWRGAWKLAPGVQISSKTYGKSLGSLR